MVNKLVEIIQIVEGSFDEAFKTSKFYNEIFHSNYKLRNVMDKLTPDNLSIVIDNAQNLAENLLNKQSNNSSNNNTRAV